ncbi:hypothetical protein HNV10_10505 [Winogradskyella litoriviva]|uniref:WG repeat-containing protein n=1 Tax=Winogradskyella litoriviva TaxID=1220182 RepID=A0ABX2E7B0_9FLAO|nr:hypothetical protein [Winogradskyella litoriviva]NRD23674.1 hypothetical protein [Winogradskyella litoriviva]
MKSFTTIALIFFSLVMHAQNDSITGSYYQSSGNPEGGTTFIVLPNNHFVVAYFGGVQKGTWKLVDNNTYEFKYHSEPKFVLYGRQNPQFKDSVAISFAVDRSRGIAFRINGKKNDSFTPMFNKNANCFSYPYIYKQTEKLTSLDAFSPDYRNFRDGKLDDLPGFYKFEINEDYNDYIIAGLSEEYSQGGIFYATYNDGFLVLDERNKLNKRAEIDDIDKETLDFVYSHTQSEILPDILEYGNEFFPHIEDPTDNDLIPFKRLEFTIESSKDVVVSEKNLFFASCDD